MLPLSPAAADHDAQTTLAIDRVLYPEYRQVEAAASSSPLILVMGLQRYLDNFPYGCTEQLTSKVFPLLAMADQPRFAHDAQAIADKIQATIQMLGQRQMSSGAFSYWPGLGDNSSNDYITVYAMHFLTEARAQNYNIPGDMFSTGLSYLQSLAGQNVNTMEMARTQAYAIYILTRNEMITTNYLTNLQLYLDQDKTQAWQHELIGAYVAATYQLMKSTTEANQLIDKYQIQTQTAGMNNFYDNNIANAQYLYLLARHFPERLPRAGDKLVLQLVAAINSDDINTLFSSFASLALSAYGQSADTTNTHLSISEVLADHKQQSLANTNNIDAKANIDMGAVQVIFANPDKQPYFYQLMQAGFDKKPPTESIQNGLEVYREYRNNGGVVELTPLGTELEVHIQVRALADRYLSNIAIIDLLPGGFEVIRESVNNEEMEYIDIREDRVIFFGSVGSSAKEIVYRIKATNPGKYTAPAIYAESMYDPNVRARSVAGTITVSNAP